MKCIAFAGWLKCLKAITLEGWEARRLEGQKAKP